MNGSKTSNIYTNGRRYENLKELEKWYQNREPIEYPDAKRPKTRKDCHSIPRPCPFVSCEHHLYLEVIREGKGILYNNEDVPPWEMKNSCVLDLADEGAISKRAISRLLNVGPMTIQDIEEDAFNKIKRRIKRLGKDPYNEREYPTDISDDMRCGMPSTSNTAEMIWDINHSWEAEDQDERDNDHPNV